MKKNKLYLRSIIITSLVAASVFIAANCMSDKDASKTIIFPPSHPRLLYTAAEADALRNSPDMEKERRSFVARADQVLGEKLFVPQKGGQWIFYYACPKDGSGLTAESAEAHVCQKCKTRYTDERTNAAYITSQNYRLENQLYDLALGYAASGERKYVMPVKYALLELAKVYPTLGRHDRWGRTGLLAVVGGRRYCQHLDEATSAIKLAKTYDLCASSDVFSPEDRKKIEQDFLAATVREIQNYEIFVGRKNNHQTWFNAAYATVGVAIGDSKLINDSIYGTGGLLWQLKNSVTDDGIWYEGTMSYHFYALSAIIENLKAVQRVGWDFSGNERLKSLWSGPLAMAFPDGSIPALHDGDPFSLTGMKKDYLFAGEYFKDPVFAKIANEKSQDQVLPSQVLSDIGVGILRQGSGADAKCAMMDYGIHGDHHGHPDKLNLILYALGLEVFLDPGRISYSVPEYESWSRTTVAHNTVVINGENQKPDTGKLLHFEIKPEYSACFAESDSAYSRHEISRFLLLADNFLIDVFRVEGSRKDSLDWLLHVRGDLKLPGSIETKKIVSLGDKNGYQHLKEIQSLQSSGNYVFDAVQKDGRFVRIHLLDEKESQVFTGIGIGAKLSEKVPFILRRREAPSTVFVSFYDLSGDGSSISGIEILPVMDGNGKVLTENEAVGLKLKLKDSTVIIAFDLKEKTSPLSFQNNKFERLLYLKQQ